LQAFEICFDKGRMTDIYFFKRGCFMKMKRAGIIAGIILGGMLSILAGAQDKSNKAGSGSKDRKPAYRIITDMAGRKVKIPVKISKVLCTSPPLTSMIFIVAPDKLEASSAPKPKENGKEAPGGARTAPATPGWGRGASRSYESYIAAHPDILFDGCAINGNPSASNADLARVNETQEKVGTIPVVCINSIFDITNYSATFKFLGDVLNVSTKANALIAYHKQVFDEVQAKVSKILNSKRVRVYYAVGSDGLQTNPTGSRHAQLIELCGGTNVVGNDLKESSGTTVTVTKESLLLWNPDIIITANPRLIAQINGDETWQQTKAVKNRRVHLIPTKPQSWFDRPPGANRIVGIPWLAHVFYPNLFSEDWFRKKAKEFYKLFYQLDLSDSDLASLLAP
jgi:iron complex transport system substrate-binding protein